VVLRWTASPTANSWYQVYLRNASSGQSWQKVATPVTTCCTMTAGYLTNGDTYQFKITAINGAGESTPTSVVSAKPLPPLPGAPSGLTAAAGDGKVVLRWTASPTAGVYYDVFLRDTTAGQSWQKLELPVTTCCTMTAGHLSNGHRYEFRVAASNLAGRSPMSNTAAATPLPPMPLAPSNLRATAGDGKVTLNWSASPTAGVYYLVEYRASGAGNWTRAKLPVTNCCSFVAGYLANGTTYEFRVRATNMAGDSSPSNTASARPMPPFPQAPSGLTATAGDGKVILKWTKSPTPGVYYLVEYKKSNGSTWTRLKLPVASCCTFTAGYLTNGEVYNFRIRATNLSGDSAASNIASAKPLPPLPARVTALSGYSPGVGRVELQWGASGTPNVLYWIEHRMAGDSNWIRLPLFATNTSASLYRGFRDGELHQFRVIAFNAAGESAISPYAHIVVTRGTSAYTRQGNQLNGANLAAKILYGASDDCAPAYYQRVCFEPSPGDDRPATVGDYFFYPSGNSAYQNRIECEAYKRASIRVDLGRDAAESRGPDIERHESIHADQSAGYILGGYTQFVAEYGVESVKSKLMTGNYWQENRFEKKANLYWGGYLKVSGGRHHPGPTCSSWFQ